MNTEGNIIVYDGSCNLCDGVVSWVLKNTPKDEFQYIPFQSKTGQYLLEKNHFPTDRLDTVILFTNQKVYTKSTGFIKILSKIKGWKNIAYVLNAVPMILRDSVYDFAAKNRLKWFGKHNGVCALQPNTNAL